VSAIAERDIGLIERSRTGIDCPTMVAAGRSRLQKVSIVVSGEIRVYDARAIDEVSSSSLLYFDSRIGLSDVLALDCCRGIFVVPAPGAMVALHYWGML
jgi:hypothetical protein